MKTEATACILCSRNCGLLVDHADGKFVRIRGDEQHPVSRGYLCQKPTRLAHYQEHADRITQPLQRQPDGSFVQVTWESALSDIARRLVAIREAHSGDAFAFVGGGGQGNHLGGAYGTQLLAAMKSRFLYNSLAQEKTGDFWVNGRLFGSQSCHTTEDVEHADYVLFIGTNPYQAHGITNARDTLHALRKDTSRTMVVIDPRRTETAKLADVHLQLKPGTDAFLLTAMLAIIVREGLHDRAFLAAHCTGFEEIERFLREVPVEEYVQRADVPLALVEQVARGYATAERGCIRIDLGIQHSLHTTLNGYLEKLLYLVTGNFGKRGTNNLHSLFLPIIGNTDERRARRGKGFKRSVHHRMHPISGLFPPNILADEITLGGERRLRAIFVDSCNPLVTYADTSGLERAFGTLELLVVVDVAMTETARLAHYVLPAASQFEKWEATGFNLEFPENYFHLRKPLFTPPGECLPEPEIYTRILEQMGVLPERFPVLERIARDEPRSSRHLGYMAALGALIARKRHWIPFAPSILYRTLGKALPHGAAIAAPLLPLSIAYANRHYAAVKRAGHRGNRATLGSALFEAILQRRSGVIISRHEYADTWRFIANSDRRVHLFIAEMFDEWRALRDEVPPGADAPFILMAGERRGYNANQIYRNPAWRKVDPEGALRMHPADAELLTIGAGERVRVANEHGSIEVVIDLDDSVRQGMVTLPHGYGQRYAGGAVVGPELNRLTHGSHCDPRSRTPFHKYVPVHIHKLQLEAC